MDTELPLTKSEPQEDELVDSLSWKLIEAAQNAIENNGKCEAEFKDDSFSRINQNL